MSAAVWTIPSSSRPELTHLVMRLPDGTLTCTCEAATYGRMCRHRVAVLFAEGDPMSVTQIKPSTDYAIGAIEAALAQGDLSKLSTEDRTRYLLRVCESLQLNPLTRPLQYIVLSNKLTLYATRDATDQLRKLHGVSVRIVSRERIDDLYLVQSEATDKTGRTDSSLGVVSIKGLQGEALANAIMKTETKAKRRVTLSICGLGMLDETEVESVRIVEGQQAARQIAPATDQPATQAQYDWYMKAMSALGFNGEDRRDIAVDIGQDELERIPARVLQAIVMAAKQTLLTYGPDGETGRVAWRIQQVGDGAEEESASE